MSKQLVAALFCFGLAALAGLVLFVQPDWLTLNSSRIIGCGLFFLGSGALLARLP